MSQDFLPINGTDHVEFYVGNAKQAAHFYQSAFGFELVAYAGPETGVRDKVSYVLQQNKIRFVLTTSLQKDSEISEHVKKHGDGVKVLALWVDDATKSFHETTIRGGVAAGPIISVPGSVYGRSYVESFASLAQTFVDMTNVLLDSIQVTSIPAFQAWPDAMEDATQVQQGITPGKVFVANEDAPVGEPFLTRVDLGSVNPDAFRAWDAIRGLLREASSQSELRLGQLTNRSGVTATEIDAAEGGTEALLEHISEDVEESILTPLLNLVWPTMIQHLDPSKDERLRRELGEDISTMIDQRRLEFKDRTFHLQAKGISGLLKRSRLRRALLEVLQVVGQSEVMGQVFARSMSFRKFLDQILRTSGIDPSTLDLSEEEKVQQQAGADAARRIAAMAKMPQPPGGGAWDAC